jgi:hypothetical protein
MPNVACRSISLWRAPPREAGAVAKWLPSVATVGNPSAILPPQKGRVVTPSVTFSDLSATLENGLWALSSAIVDDRESRTARCACPHLLLAAQYLDVPSNQFL